MFEHIYSVWHSFLICHFFCSLKSPPTHTHTHVRARTHTPTHAQSPSGGTSGLCLKKLNITTSSYRIIINRLDRKVNPPLIPWESLPRLQDRLSCPCFTVCPQVTVNYRPVRLPFSRHSLYVEDTGSMYLIQTPAGVSIQWYHSTGIMVLQYITTYNASVPTQGLCGGYKNCCCIHASSTPHPR